MAPSVIYIDEAEKVFVSDKKCAKEFGGQVRSLGVVLGGLCDLAAPLILQYPLVSANPIIANNPM